MNLSNSGMKFIELYSIKPLQILYKSVSLQLSQSTFSIVLNILVSPLINIMTS